MYFVAALIILALVFVCYGKIKNFFFTAKDSKLVKEDQVLAGQEVVLKARVEELKKMQQTATNMTPEEIENFWGKK